MKNLILTFIGMISSRALIAQDTAEIEMADRMMASGKIYVVVAVLLLIFLGIVLYLILLDRKIGKLERDTNNQG
ncbi:MAG TPA: CcmD family protein [Flavobacteriales bacterium]|nr:CcmD family protein [Flavobacteriales bacterium]